MNMPNRNAFEEIFCLRSNLGLKYGQDLENQAAHPLQEFPGVHPPPRRDITLWSTGHQGGSILFHRSNFQEEDLIYSISTVHYNKEENETLCE